MAAISLGGDAAIPFLYVDHPNRLCRIATRRPRIKFAQWVTRSSLASGLDRNGGRIEETYKYIKIYKPIPPCGGGPEWGAFPPRTGAEWS
jgi:hypothetical protein